jgi:hypothetical protein
MKKTIVTLILLLQVSCSTDPFIIEATSKSGNPITVTSLGWTIMTKSEETEKVIENPKTGLVMRSRTRKLNETTVPNSLIAAQAAVEIGAQTVSDSIAKTKAGTDQVKIKEESKVLINESKQITERAKIFPPETTAPIQ